MTRNRYADLLRVVAICGVVYGHWLLVSVTYQQGRLSGVDAIDYIRWGRWVTWAMQVMPVFFLVGGYVNAGSWQLHHGEGQTWTRWVRDRVMRLMWPTAAYIVVALVGVLIAQAAEVPSAELREIAWLTALHLWFLPVYLLLNALTPVLLAAHRRWGLAVPAAMAVATGLVEVVRLAPGLHFVGYANYLFVWGGIHQWGFFWLDGTLTSPRRRPYVLSLVGAALLVGLVASGAFKVDMVGSGNTNPPSVALLAFAAAQSGLVLAAEPWFTRRLAGPRLWRRIRRLNSVVMNVYLWHFVPALLVALVLYPTGVFGQAAIGSAQWWEQKAIWLVLLTLVLIPVVAAVSWAERPMLRLPGGIGPVGWWSPVLLVVGIGAAAQSLAMFAVDGFAPDGGLPVPALSGFALGLLATLLTGRAPQPGGDNHRPQRLQAGDHALGDPGVPVAVQFEQEPGGGDQYQHGEDG
ncbi:acyltransferase 3 [Catenulispora acidiphila DSM 44928]|uniref:Acyltransferase 3 n=1 Tax=Catenulispora acidiphila (strain DSM 44928 / JCM 14897 / NBRC 102108 / NRRL B-24433 / ID139908) TaxID=479433 RepID=C7PXV0_CATAD|nr:acyltransferase [Catenulispora acidiphila]ACU73410.1 acyltransferase 3 [Catenulispora acidiphila DSM 44928]